MARAMFQVLVLPFRRTGGGSEYAALRRADCGAWQGVAGGGEGPETIATAAHREIAEETGRCGPLLLYPLQSTASIPVDCFGPDTGWPVDIYVIPEYAFGLDCTGLEITLSPEHGELCWGPYKIIHDLLTWDSNRIALGELNERLRRGDLRPHSR